MTSPDGLPIGHYGPGSPSIGDWEFPDIDLIGLGDEILFGPIRQLLSAVTGLPIETWPTVPDVIAAASSALTQVSQVVGNFLQGVIPIGWLSAETPNLLTNGGFDGAVSITAGEGWSWDDTVGRSKPGSARFACSGVRGVQMSTPVQVADGQKLDVATWVRWVGVTAGSGPAFSLAVRWWDATTLLGETVIDSVTSAAASSDWVELGGQTTTPAGASTATVTLIVADTISAGTVWFDDASLVKPTTTLPQQWVSGLVDALDSLGEWIEHLVDTALDALGLPTLGGLGDRILDFADALGDMLTLGEDNAAGLDSLIGKLISDPAAVIGSIPRALVSGLDAALANVNGYVQDLVNAILRAIRKVPVVGGTIADIISEIGGLKDTADTATAGVQSVRDGIVDGWAGNSGAGADQGVFDTMAAIKAIVAGDGYTRVNITANTLWGKPAGVTEVVAVCLASGAQGENGQGPGSGGAGGRGGGHMVKALDPDAFSSLYVVVGSGNGLPTQVFSGSTSGPKLVEAISGGVGAMATQFGYTGSNSAGGAGGSGGRGATETESRTAGLPGEPSAAALGGIGGTGTASNGGAGTAGQPVASASSAIPCGGGGGGGGQGCNTANIGSNYRAGDGGPGGFPSGGGGGGGGKGKALQIGSSTTDGAGGAGAAGMAIIYYR